MNIYVKLFLYLILIFSFAMDVSPKTILTRSELIKISVGSAGVAAIGLVVKNSVTLSQTSLIKGPILFDDYMYEQISHSGDFNSADNFLDDHFGELLTPILGATSLFTLDYLHYGGSKKREIFQDCYLFSTGLLTTAGVTALFKGLVARERPYYYYQTTKSSFSRDDKQSFFSGHSSSAFFSMHFLNKRVSTIMREKEISWGWQWTKSITCYGWASYVAYSRVKVSKHYATDVLIGAATGMLFAELFFQFGEGKADVVSIQPSHSGVVISYHF